MRLLCLRGLMQRVSRETFVTGLYQGQKTNLLMLLQLQPVPKVLAEMDWTLRQERDKGYR